MIEEKIFKPGSTLFLTGISLVSLVFFGPDAARHRAGSFFEVAASSSWGKWLQFAAAWCSFKIILLSLGLFLVIESLVVILAAAKGHQLARVVYFLHLMPCFGFLIGGYYLIKALL